jgi:hypothetical protein
MKNLFLAIATLLSVSLATQAQYNKDGSPDMRYNANKQIYGSTYQQPKSNYSSSSNFSTPTYSTPSYSLPSYTTPKVETYTTPSYNNYSQPRSDRQSAFPSYPTTKSGAPDMRFKENKQVYGLPRF